MPIRSIGKSRKRSVINFITNGLTKFPNYVRKRWVRYQQRPAVIEFDTGFGK